MRQTIVILFALDDLREADYCLHLIILYTDCINPFTTILCSLPENSIPFLYLVREAFRVVDTIKILL